MLKTFRLSDLPCSKSAELMLYMSCYIAAFPHFSDLYVIDVIRKDSPGNVYTGPLNCVDTNTKMRYE